MCASDSGTHQVLQAQSTFHFPGCSAGLAAVMLPHCRQRAAEAGQATVPLSITPAAIKGKLEILQLHDMVAEAEWLAQQAQHEAVADSLAPFLLSCDAKEESMAALDALQWQHALGMLRDAALACGRAWVAAACQLRLAWHELARLRAATEVGADEGGWSIF
jgi:hypothetical protein